MSVGTVIMFRHIFKILDRRSRLFSATAVLLCVCGCGDFFAHKPTEFQTQRVLSDLREIKENPNISNPLPELYRRPPERIEVRGGVKIFYFCRHHSANKLAELVNTQFAEFFRSAPSQQHPQGREYPKQTYPVSPNPATNQLIIHCPNDEEADKVLLFLDKVDVPPIQVNIDCLILERFADITMDWETTIKIENLLGEKITLGGKTDTSGKLLPAFPGASLRESKRSTFGLDVGYWKNQGVTGHEIRAVVDMLISRGYLKILMNPTLETINGQTGMVRLRDNVPLEKIMIKPGFDTPFNLTDYQWVEDTLKVTPYVYADGSIGLSTMIQLGSKSKPEGVVQTSIITERTIEIAENRIRPGESLVIGGMRKSEERGVVRGVPFLKDIPIIGVLFSSKDFEEKSTEVIFILTPTISSGGVAYDNMLKDVRQKLAKPEYEANLYGVLADPLGLKAYSEHMEQQAAQSELERLRAEAEKTKALRETAQMQERMLGMREEILVEKAKAAAAQSETLKARQEAEKARVEGEKVRKEAENAKTEAQKSKAESDKSKAAAESDKTKEAEAKAEAKKAGTEATEGETKA